MKSLVRIRMEHLRAETTRVKFLVEEAQQQNNSDSVIQFSRIDDRHVRAMSVCSRPSPASRWISFSKPAPKTARGPVCDGAGTRRTSTDIK